MNTVLFSSAPDSSSALKAKPSRQAFDSSPSGNDASDFAGVLANQAAPQVQPTGTASSGAATTGTDSSHSSPRGSAKANGDTALQQSVQNRGTSDARDNTVTHQKNQTGIRLTHGQQARVLDPTANAHRPTPDIAHTIKDGTDATLPQRFAQIIAAMERTGGRHTDLPLEGKNTLAGKTTATGDTTGATLSDARTRLASGVKRPGLADGLKSSETRSTRLDDTAGLTRQPLPDGRSNLGQFALNGDTASFNINESDRQHTESLPDRTVHASIHTSDSLLNPVAAGAGFSLVPGPAYGSDIMATSATIGQPLFSKQWGPELGRQFMSLIRPGENGSHIAELRLDPPELGPLRVTININDSVVQALFTSSHANVRNAVEQALPQLQQQLEQEGLSLGQTSVGHDDDTSQAHPDFAQASSSGGRNDADVSTAPASRHRRVPDALVDTFA